MSFNRKALAWGLGLFLLVALVPGVLAQEATVQVSDHPELGRILTDGEGMTLYLFTEDDENVSNCYDQCATNWPPLLVGEGAEPMAGEGLTGELGVIDRTDGGRQVTYNGMPLYYWAQDSQPGDVTGQGRGGVWFVVHPDISTMTVTSPVVQTMEHSEHGAILTNQGMTLYMYTRDEEGVSNCYDQCAVNWPPLLVGEGGDAQAGEGLDDGLTVIDRDDGTRQVAYNGMPLYFWIQDVRPGDASGEGVGDVWFVISPGETFASFPAAPAQEAQEGQDAQDATAEPTAAAEDGDATDEQPAELPETGGENLPWIALAMVIGGAILVGAAAGLSQVRRPR